MMRPLPSALLLLVFLPASRLYAQGSVPPLRVQPYAPFLADSGLLARADTSVVKTQGFSTGGAIVGGFVVGVVSAVFSSAVYCDNPSSTECHTRVIGGALVGATVGAVLGGLIGGSFAGD